MNLANPQRSTREHELRVRCKYWSVEQFTWFFDNLIGSPRQSVAAIAQIEYVRCAAEAVA